MYSRHKLTLFSTFITLLMFIYINISTNVYAYEVVYFHSYEQAKINRFLGMLAFIIIVGIIYFISPDHFKKKGPKSPGIGYEIPDYALKSMQSYMEMDPRFNTFDFSTSVTELYMRMQECKSERDYNPIRANLTESFYSQCMQEARDMEIRNLKNYVESVSVRDALPRGYFQKDGLDHMVVRVRAQIKDYTMNVRNGKLEPGHSKLDKFVVYEWDMCRREGAKTGSRSNLKTETCPHCGAAITLEDVVECPYCGSVVATINDNWKLNSSKIITQRNL